VGIGLIVIALVMRGGPIGDFVQERLNRLVGEEKLRRISAWLDAWFSLIFSQVLAILGIWILAKWSSEWAAFWAGGFLLFALTVVVLLQVFEMKEETWREVIAWVQLGVAGIGVLATTHWSLDLDEPDPWRMALGGVLVIISVYLGWWISLSTALDAYLDRRWESLADENMEIVCKYYRMLLSDAPQDFLLGGDVLLRRIRLMRRSIRKAIKFKKQGYDFKLTYIPARTHEIDVWFEAGWPAGTETVVDAPEEIKVERGDPL
jgi:hypothetical protein